MRETNRLRSNGFKWWMVVASLAIVLIAGGVFWMAQDNTATPDMTSTTTSTTAPILAVVPDDCPVTIPDGFVPPDGYPTTPPDGKIWYGSDELWTVVPVDGIQDYQKSSWWSSDFLGAGEESHPEIEVTYESVGNESEPIINNNATVANTPEGGSFMNVGFQPDIQGCWEVTATYKGATLSYVYYSAAGQSLTIQVPDLVGMTVSDAFQDFAEGDLFVTFAVDPGGIEETRRALGKHICAQSPGAGEDVPRGTTVVLAVPEADGTCLDLGPSLEVPDIVGSTIEVAMSQLRDTNLSALIYGRSSGPGDLVCSQDPPTGTLVSPGQGVTIQVVAPGGCEEMLSPNGLYSRSYVDDAGLEWFGTDCPLADVMIRGGHGDGLPQAGETAKMRVDQLLEESGLDLVQPGVVSFRSLPRSGQVWDYAENGDIVVLDGEDDYMIKVTKDETFVCPTAPYFWNGIPVAFTNS